MTQAEFRKLATLQRKWATGRATKAEILRCMELERERSAENKRKYAAKVASS